MLPCYFTSAKLYAKKDISNLIINDGKYTPKYEGPFELLEENEFLNLFQESHLKSKITTDEHEIAKRLVESPPIWESPNSIYDFRLFLHWYERKYKTNIVNENILINLNSFSELWLNRNNKVSHVYSKEECKKVIYKNILSFSQSERFIGFSLFYENYFPIFPDLESISFEDFKGVNFIKYLIDLFPTIKGVTSKKLHFIRFSFEQPNDWEFEGGIHYHGKYQLPSFVPTVLNKGNQIINYRNLENLLRSNKGLPKIGEGWISETTLFYLIKQKFNQYEIIQHGSPTWLGRQHLDIYFPQYNIGIEYQGKQHTEPINFFGGEDALAKTIERDNRKKKLCFENNCTLLFVFPETNTEDFLEELENILSNQNN
jgi:hypothetical protein